MCQRCLEIFAKEDCDLTQGLSERRHHNDARGITFVVLILYQTVRSTASHLNVLNFLLMKGHLSNHHLGDANSDPQAPLCEVGTLRSSIIQMKKLRQRGFQELA